jgi:hypothetical protein
MAARGNYKSVAEVFSLWYVNGKNPCVPAMIPGLNSNVTHEGIEYHVQTEDLGRGNPYVLTLVFRAGAIIAREKVNYRDALGEGASEIQVKKFIDGQHHRIIQRVLAGQAQSSAPSQTVARPPSQTSPSPQTSPPPPKPPAPATDEALDRLITEYIRGRKAQKPQ